MIAVLLPRYSLGRGRESHGRRHLQSFGEKSIEPQLFAMAMAQSGAEQVSATRAQLYERDLRRLMRGEGNDMLWRGWRNLMVGKADDGRATESLVKRLPDFYHRPVSDALSLLQHLAAGGILQGERRWRFAPDTFEEYFAASYLVSSCEENAQWPILDKWIGVHEREPEFLELLDFARAMVDESTKRRILMLT